MWVINCFVFLICFHNAPLNLKYIFPNLSLQNVLLAIEAIKIHLFFAKLKWNLLNVWLFWNHFIQSKYWVKCLPLYHQSKVVCTLVHCSFSFLVGNVSSWLIVDFDNHVTHTKTNSFSNWSRCYLQIYHLHQLSKNGKMLSRILT